MIMINFQKLYSISKGVYTQELDGEIILLDSNGEHYFNLNEIGTKIWQLLETGKSPQQILELIKNEYSVEEINLRKDLTTFLKELSIRCLIYPLPT